MFIFHFYSAFYHPLSNCALLQLIDKCDDESSKEAETEPKEKPVASEAAAAAAATAAAAKAAAAAAKNLQPDDEDMSILDEKN